MPEPVLQEETTNDSFSVNDFLKEAADIETPDVSHVSETTDPDNPDKAEIITEEDHSGDVSVDQIRLPGQPPPSKSRKFDGLAEDEIPLFKQMSNAAYDRIYPEWLKRKEAITAAETAKQELEAARNRRFYEEEGAWELHPEVKSLRQNADNLETEEAFWKEQLAAVEDGKPWYPLAMNEKGEYTYGKENQPSPAAKAEIISKLLQCSTLKERIQSKLEGHRSTFKSRFDAVKSGLSAAHKEMFGKFPMDNPSIKSEYEAALEKFPKEFRDQEVYQMLAKSYVIIPRLVQLLRQKETSAAAKTAVKRVVVNNGPSSGTSPGTGATNTKDLDRRFEAMTGQRLS